MLTNTAYRLHRNKKLTVGFFGGSITEGAGASNWDETSWRAHLTKYLQTSYPTAEIIAINAAVGGTGSDLGLYRCQHDLLKYRPDLVFMEFAVNDKALPFAEQLSSYESCIRQILKNDPTTEIVCVFTATKETEQELLKTGDYRSRTAQTILAYHYGLEMVNIGEYLRAEVIGANGDWKRYTTDGTHPNDDGHRIYAEVMKLAIRRLLAEIPEEIAEKTLPAPYVGEENLICGKLCEAQEYLFRSRGFSLVNQPFKDKFPYYVRAIEGIGSEMTVPFEGSNFGIYLIMDYESGMLELTLDGKETKTVSAWDEYCKLFSRAGYILPFKNLENGPHTVTLRVSNQKDEGSLGNHIAIFAFLIS